MKGVLISMLVVVAMIQFMAKPGEGLNCSQVESSLASCIPHLMNGGSPAAACCDGVKNPNNITPTIADRRAACNCFKAAAARYPNIQEDAALFFQPMQCSNEYSHL